MGKMFKRILIANRGEIAIRIARAAKALGCETVAIYSEADAKALHVKVADRAISVGPPPPAESYLHMNRVLSAAKEAGCDAIHPGYGFLSENAVFIKRCLSEGIAFIGPDASSIESMTDKVAARAAFSKVGLPIIPGSEIVADLAAAQVEAERIGYPLMVKAAGGGGGIGMSRIDDFGQLATAFDAAKARAEKAFGDGRIYLERFVPSPHHVEVQILGDGTDVIHLVDRECSVQRRFQKVVEEARCPYPAAPTDEMAVTAAAAAQKLGYKNAGTVECLVSGEPGASGKAEWFFLEVNRRIQVEHPVTEAITGLDLVQAQIRIAADGKLPFSQADVKPKGHAIELRICAEDPFKFFPAPGTIAKWIQPVMEHVRIDAGVEAGSNVPMFYDPLLAKLIAWGDTRDAAIDRALEAVNAFTIEGVKTSLPLHKEILKDPVFREGITTTGYLDDLLKRLRAAGTIK